MSYIFINSSNIPIQPNAGYISINA